MQQCEVDGTCDLLIECPLGLLSHSISFRTSHFRCRAHVICEIQGVPSK